MASPLREDVLVMDARYHFNTWLNELPQVNDPDEVEDRCDCNFDRCVLLRPTSFSPKTPTLVELPCGCRFRKECAERFFGNDRYPRTRCPGCESELFQLRTIEEWITDEAEEVDIPSLEEEDRTCSICRMDYSAGEDDEGQAEQPLKLPCQHIFGDQCIKIWLNAGPTAASRRSCPTCREGIVYTAPKFARSEDIPLERSELLTELEYDSFDAAWTPSQLDDMGNYW